MVWELHIILLLVLACLEKTLAVSECWGKTETVIGDREVKLFHERISFNSAQARCKVWGENGKKQKPGRLLSIMNEKEQECIEDMIASLSKAKSLDFSLYDLDFGYFAGASRLRFKNIWIWKNEEKVDYSNWAGPRKFTRNFGDNCMHLVARGRDEMVGKWAAARCGAEKFYICEREAEFPASVWTYDSSSEYPPTSWKNLYPQCDGSRQSPIDVSDFRNVPDCKLSQRLVRGWRTLPRSEWIIENTGRFIRITPSPRRSLWTTFYGSSRRHFVDFMILKWGDANSGGSDHLMLGRRATGELQIFHERHSQDQRHALSFLIQQEFLGNSMWANLIENILKVRYPHLPAARMKAPRTGIRALLGRDSSYILGVAFRYNGSLPHPPCSEDVVWTVFPRPTTLSRLQFSILRQTRTEDDSKLLLNNFRPVQNNLSPFCAIHD